MKRAFDLLFATAGLVLLSPLMVVIAAAIKLSSPGPVFFRQQRMGRDFQPFEILKFRTMAPNAEELGGPLTAGEDPRVTVVGKLLRKTKLDELPQLLNVVRGEMSLVGPRPEVAKYVAVFRKDYEELLTVRPGITDLASIRYRDEARLLGQSQNPEAEYLARVLPRKIALAKKYLARRSLLLDIKLILATLGRLVLG